MFVKYFSRSYSVHLPVPCHKSYFGYRPRPGPRLLRHLESPMCHNQRSCSPLGIVILSGASRDRFKLPATVPSRTASRAGSESGAAAGRSGQGGAEALHSAPLAAPGRTPGWWNSDLARNFRHGPSPSRRRRIRRVESAGPGQGY